jgi:hypothetical protein
MKMAVIALEGGGTVKPRLDGPEDYKRVVDAIVEAQTRTTSQGAGVRRSSGIG